jgi:hypothetical protein
MSKHKSRKPKRAAPRFRRVIAGQVWRIQRLRDADVTHPVLAAEIDEVTPETVLIRWLDDGAIQAKPSALAVRYARKDFEFLELIRY